MLSLTCCEVLLDENVTEVDEKENVIVVLWIIRDPKIWSRVQQSLRYITLGPPISQAYPQTTRSLFISCLGRLMRFGLNRNNNTWQQVLSSFLNIEKYCGKARRDESNSCCITGLIFFFEPLTPMSDQDRISPYSVNTISSRQVMRIKKNIN